MPPKDTSAKAAFYQEYRSQGRAGGDFAANGRSRGSNGAGTVSIPPCICAAPAAVVCWTCSKRGRPDKCRQQKCGRAPKRKRAVQPKKRPAWRQSRCAQKGRETRQKGRETRQKGCGARQTRRAAHEQTPEQSRNHLRVHPGTPLARTSIRSNDSLSTVCRT
jgi:hypothetical protein